MVLVVIIAFLLLALVGLAGWFRAWQLGRHPPISSVARDLPNDLSAAESRAADQISRSIESATELFQKNLTVQALKVNDTLEGLAGQRLKKQVEDFTSVMDGLTSTATSSVAQLESLVDARRKALEASMSTEVIQEKQRAVDHFYNHLSDLVAGYIVETLGDDIDLSGQLPFVLQVLEQNRTIIREDVLGEH